ncbi:MAG TPA: pilus assembly PilX N-terminal domain-containing protein [Gemmatimonadales bacterium]|nr:pilus assembly PilX N-terminal domain-containing protein [Gemmatimonadales bacterium]
MKRVWQDERGIALAIAIFALIVVGVLVAGAFFAGTQEQRVGVNSRRVQQAFGVAEVGVAERLATWRPDSLNQRGIYPADSVPIPPTAAPFGTGSYGGIVAKLNPDMFLIDVTGSDVATRAGRTQGGSGARQRVGLLTRLDPVQLDIKASLTTQGTVILKGTAAVNGNDQYPTGWLDCGPLEDALAGIRAQPGAKIDTAGGASVSGVPLVLRDATLADSSFTNFSGVTYADLAAGASVTLPGGVYKTQPTFINGRCNTADLTNWGDGQNPSSACGSYFPIIHITGSATLNGSQGQGLLLVDGDLTVDGGYEWFGLTIVQGSFQTAGGGKSPAHFWGATLARNADLDVQDMAGHATVNYSSCGVRKALLATSRPTMLRSRGWVQLY